MAVIQRPFGGLLTDLDPTQVSSGSADIALNVTVENGQLAKRAGFAEYEDDVNGSATGILFMDVARFADGGVYVIVKLADGKLYHRKAYPAATAATAFTELHTGFNATDIGWSFMWRDRWHYFDRSGGHSWVSAGTIYKAGLPQFAWPTAATEVAADNGGLEGTYHTYATVYNSVTGQESDHSDSHAAVTARVSETLGALLLTGAVGGITTDVGAHYEYDTVIFYRSLGNTELIGAGAGYAFTSYRAYEDTRKAKTDTAAFGLYLGDDALPIDRQMINKGGEPPGAIVGCSNGVYAIYGQVYDNSTARPGVIRFSLPNYPTMVPKRQSYDVAGIVSDTMTVEPRPWLGEAGVSCQGPMTGIVYGGGVTVLFTPTETWLIGAGGDGRLYARKRDTHRGCVNAGACASTPWSVHAMGTRCWLEVSAEGLVDIAENRFRETLEDIPVAQQIKTRMGYYSHKDQVWAAVVKTAKTVAQRILVWDRQAGTVSANGAPMGALTIYEPVNLASDEAITAMCELAVPNAAPLMLVGTSDGRILKFPVGTQDDSTSYAAQWRGYFATEGLGREQTLDGIDIHTGSNVANNVTMKMRAQRTGTDTPDQKTQVLTVSNEIIPNTSVVFDRQDARLWQVEFISADTVTTGWDIPGLTFKTRRK